MRNQIHVEMERQCALLGCLVLRDKAHQEVVGSEIDNLDGDRFAETYAECFVMAYINSPFSKTANIDV